MEDAKTNVARLDTRRSADVLQSERRPVHDLPRRHYAGTAEGQAPDVMTVVRRISRAAWRRRRLIAIPLVLMTLVGLAGAVLLPRTYVARTLLMLQESVRHNPLAPRGTVDDRIHERVAGLDAMLKSDAVLSRVIDKLAPDGRALVARPKAQAIRDLREALSLDLIGTDFVEIRLRGEKFEGMGNTLAVVTAQLLEALVADGGGLNAGRFLAERAAMERADAEHERDQAALRLARARGAGSTDVSALEQALADREAILARAVREAESLEEQLGPRDTPPVGLLNAPEQIVVVDPPTDPLLPTSSRLIYAISGVAAGLLLGALLAFAAETLDPRIREPEDLAIAAGVPVLGRLPPFAPARNPRRRRLGRWLPIAALTMAIGLGIAWQLWPPLRSQTESALRSADTKLSQLGNWIEQTIGQYF